MFVAGRGRLHQGCAGRYRGAAGAAVPGDEGAHPGGRPERARQAGAGWWSRQLGACRLSAGAEGRAERCSRVAQPAADSIQVFGPQPCRYRPAHAAHIRQAGASCCPIPPLACRFQKYFYYTRTEEGKQYAGGSQPRWATAVGSAHRQQGACHYLRTNVTTPPTYAASWGVPDEALLLLLPTLLLLYSALSPRAASWRRAAN